MAQTAVRLLLNGLDTKYGLSLVPAATVPAALDELSADYPDNAIAALAPYSAVLENPGPDSIRRFTVRYTITPSHGAGPHVHGTLYAGSTVTGVLPPHTSQLITPLGGINTVTELDSATQVTLSIDSVELWDNTIDGPDLTGVVHRMTQQTESTAAFLEELAAKLQTPSNDADVISWLETEHRTKIFVDPSTHRSDWKAKTRKSLAWHYLYLLRNPGRQTAMDRLEEQFRAAQATTPPTRRA